MRKQKRKLTAAVLIAVVTVTSSCSKQQYRARSKHYPHEAPRKQ